jgi:hypothetical protein
VDTKNTKHKKRDLYRLGCISDCAAVEGGGEVEAEVDESEDELMLALK